MTMFVSSRNLPFVDIHALALLDVGKEGVLPGSFPGLTLDRSIPSRKCKGL